MDRIGGGGERRGEERRAKERGSYVFNLILAAGFAAVVVVLSRTTINPNCVNSALIMLTELIYKLRLI